MRFTIKHETVYRYTAAAYYSIQQLRLTPRAEAFQRVLSWHIDAPGRLTRFADAYGNVTHTLVLSSAHDEIRVVVNGTVEIEPLPQGRLAAADISPGIELSPLVFKVPTPLTMADQTVRTFTERHLRPDAGAAEFLQLAQAIRGAVAYESGVTEVTSTAAQALAIGRGVCQDHAHLFIACCRAVGTPARYVSGYVHPGDTQHAASHAWADVWLEGQGWISIDITHGEYTQERHCRLAIGKDYLSAAPVRGVRTGGGEESLEVRVAVHSNQ